MSEPNKIEEIFQAALSLPSDKRSKYLHQHCDDEHQRNKVERLISYHELQGGGLSEDYMKVSDATRSFSPPSPDGLSASEFNHGRFVPGVVLSNRYRIVGMLGKGGMGEVYRADDLELGQSVALKFLPKRVADDPRSLERFRSEVRLARQVSHPNVCRVYDIGQIEGQWFLSMEYVDGEDLAQLLKRVGRFNAERATELARELCMGLQAAHEKSVLHRDLKPANIMIDGRGKLLITDFGLAEIADDVRSDDVRSGTPAYMSPEQLAGREVTERSDIYSMGIILHEIYTGKPVWEAGSMAELLQKRSSSMPTTSSLTNLDPLVETVIQRCLEPDPEKRPNSALSVLAGLPGGDPLQAALAAGETPSPEMIVNASQDGRLTLPVGTALFAILCLLLFSIPLSTSWRQRFQFGKLDENKPDVLERIAEEHLSALGLKHEQRDTASGFEYSSPGVIEFWYRQSSHRLSPTNPDLWGANTAWRITSANPPNTMAGLTSMRLGNDGRLLELLSTADAKQETADDYKPTEWDALFAATCLRQSDYQPVNASSKIASIVAMIPHDKIHYWQSRQKRTDVGGILATSLNGRLNYVTLLGQGHVRKLSGSTQAPRSTLGLSGLHISFSLAVALILAVRNLFTARVDIKSAAVIAIVVFIVDLVGWCILTPKFASIVTDIDFTSNYLLRTSGVAFRTGIYYFAFEPLIRRFYPTTLISLARLLDGRFRDAQLCREILTGTLAGVALAACAGVFGENLLDFPDGPEQVRARVTVGALVSKFAYVAAMTLGGLAQLIFVTALIRHKLSAAILFIVIITLSDLSADWTTLWLITKILVNTLVVFGCVRFGLVFVFAFIFSYFTLVAFPFAPQFDDWYATSSFIVVGFVLLFGAYGFAFSTVVPNLQPTKARRGAAV